MKLICILAAVALMAAPALRAEGGPDAAVVAALVSAIRAEDCRLIPETATRILAVAKLSEEDAALAMARLVDAGQAEPLAAGGWRLDPALCKQKD